MDCPRLFHSVLDKKSHICLLLKLLIFVPLATNLSADENHKNSFKSIVSEEILIPASKVSMNWIGGDNLFDSAIKLFSYTCSLSGPAENSSSQPEVNTRRQSEIETYSSLYILTILPADQNDDRFALNNLIPGSLMEYLTRATDVLGPVFHDRDDLNGMVVDLGIYRNAQVDAYKNDPDLEREIFDNDSDTDPRRVNDEYWSYYQDVDRWNAVIKARLPQQVDRSIAKFGHSTQKVPAILASHSYPSSARVLNPAESVTAAPNQTLSRAALFTQQTFSKVAEWVEQIELLVQKVRMVIQLQLGCEQIPMLLHSFSPTQT